MSALLALPLLKGLPSWAVRVLLVLLVIALLVGYGWFKGNAHGTAKLDAYKLAEAKNGQRIGGLRQKVTERVVIQYREAAAKTTTVREEINNEVIRYVDRKIDNSSLSAAAVELHDAAAANRLPDATRGADGTASGLETATLTQTCTQNYAICNITADRLRALQDWNRRQAEVK